MLCGLLMLPTEPLDRSLVIGLLARTRTLDGREFAVLPIYNDDPYEKCFRVDAEGATYKARIATTSNPSAVASEAATLTLLAERGLHWAPRLLESATVDDIPVLICEYLPGRSIDKHTEWHFSSNDIVHSLFSMLSQMHAITNTTFGPIGAGPQYSTWPDYLNDRLWRHLRSAEQLGYANSADLRAIEGLLDFARSRLLAVRPGLTHFDVKPANLLFDPATSRLSLIDFELTRYVDATFDFVKMDLLARHHPRFRESIAIPLLQRVPEATSNGAKDILLLYEIYFLAAVVVFEHSRPRSVSKFRQGLLDDALRRARSWRR